MSHLLEELVSEDFGIEGNNNWFRSAEHDSLVINKEKQLWFWNSRDMRGNVKDYLVLIRGMNSKDAENFITEKSRIISFRGFSRKHDYVPYDKLVDHLWNNGKKNRQYWYDRCLTDETIDRNRLGFYNGWFTVPLYKNGSFLNFQCRRDEPKKSMKLWYEGTTFKPVLYNAEILNFTNEIFITEGLIDSILLTQMGIPSISKSSGAAHWDNEWYENFQNIKNIYYIADNDKAGNNAARIVAKSLGTERVKIYRFEGEEEHFDTVNYFQRGGTKEEFIDKVKTDSKYLYETEQKYGFKFRH
jgi:Toprim domain-containing protein